MQAINGPAIVPSILEALIEGGLSSENIDDRVDARAAIQWSVYSVKRIEQLLMKLCGAWGIKDP